MGLQDAGSTDFSTWLTALLRSEADTLTRELTYELQQRLVTHEAAVIRAAQDYAAKFAVSVEPAKTALAVVPSTQAGQNGDEEPVSPRSEQRRSVVGPEEIRSMTQKLADIDLPEEIEPEEAPSSVMHYNSKFLCDLAGQQHGGDIGRNAFERFVRSNTFEYCSAMLIIACTLVMIVELQYEGLKTGYILKVRDFDEPGEKVWPHAEDAFWGTDLFFNSCFAVELTLRYWVMRRGAFSSKWMWLDTFLVSFGWLDFLGLLQFGLDPTSVRVLRLLRMLRMLKVIKSFRAFQTLFLLVRSLQSSLGALVWSFVLLWMIQIGSGIFLCQLLQGFLVDESRDVEIRQKVFSYYGTFTHSFLTMFEVTLANWIVICRLLYTEVNEWYALFFILYRGCFMFAVIKVITAVFIAETTRCTNSDDDIAVTRKKKLQEVYVGKLQEVFKELDRSGDGSLSRCEFEPLINDALLQTWLNTLDIDTFDLEHLFEILDSGDGNIDMQEFIQGMSRVRGPAKSIDVLKLQCTVDHLKTNLDNVIQLLGNKVDRPLQPSSAASHPASRPECSASMKAAADSPAFCVSVPFQRDQPWDEFADTNITQPHASAF
eukprot:gnl/TRDRNA2_/TRDRNA2_145310_c0_seq1.p1 gnl/TRDRNA2_/TRDRNA2_145310_c0~~gnl/TRDRNA2_/TRDRNA2_145310_c0_seq1.p1  ORF type:complete len:612 (+),score=95.64 gnl/TRDRNA2_/TRDRNA2_145310_c0_seq1:41-1837(+)